MHRLIGVKIADIEKILKLMLISNQLGEERGSKGSQK